MGLFGSEKKHKKDITDERLASQLGFFTEKPETADLDELKERVDRLTLICRALWSFIRENQNLEEKELAMRIEKIKTKAGEKCPSCGRPISKSLNKCLYCGDEGTGLDSFSGL